MKLSYRAEIKDIFVLALGKFRIAINTVSSDDFTQLTDSDAVNSYDTLQEGQINEVHELSPAGTYT